MSEDTINVNALAEELATTAEIPTSTAVQCVKSVFEIIASKVAEGKTVNIAGFGGFSSTHRAARTGRNPSTGATMQIEAKTVPSFKAAKRLKDKVNAK